jgi:hypothetical protein
MTETPQTTIDQALDAINFTDESLVPAIAQHHDGLDEPRVHYRNDDHGSGLLLVTLA